MMDNFDKEEIKKLKKDKNYEEIYQKYGQKLYIKNASTRYKREDLKKLSKEGRYMDIYNKYGRDTYNKYLVQAQAREIREEKGLLSSVLFRIKSKTREIALGLGIFTAITVPTFTVIGAESTKKSIEEIQATYEEEIRENDEEIAKYAQEVRDMELNDTQIIMKVMDDMWERIDGYGTPSEEHDKTGILELALTDEKAQGVCRNFATDNAKRMNAINPKYNARVVTVYMDQDSYSELADIERNVIEDNETVSSDETKNEKENKVTNSSDETKNEKENKVTKSQEIIDNFIVESFGNHMVTLVDIPEKDVTLVMDPTNPGIGVYINGKIVMLNPKAIKSDKKYAEMSAKEWTTAVINRGGIDGINDTIKDMIKSYLHFDTVDEVVDELIDEFGLEAQNKALEIVREKKKQMSSKNDNILDKKLNQIDEKDSKESSFEKRIKVNLTEEQKNKLNNIDKEDENSLNKSTNKDENDYNR